MRDFTDRGYANPAREVTQKTLREHWVMAVIQDDMAFSQAEREGLKRFLTFALPQMAIPSHQTIRRDLDILHGKLALVLTQIIKVSTQPRIHCIAPYYISRTVLLRLRVVATSGQAEAQCIHTAALSYGLSARIGLCASMSWILLRWMETTLGKHPERPSFRRYGNKVLQRSSVRWFRQPCNCSCLFNTLRSCPYI